MTSSLTEEDLNKNWGPDLEKLDRLKAECQKHVDFEFVPVEHIFRHFLMCYFRRAPFKNFKIKEKIL